VVLGGSFQRTVQLCDAPVDAAGTRDGLVARFDADGRLLWYRTVGNLDGPASVEDVIIDGSGNVLFTGAMGAPGDPIPATGALPRSVFVTKLGPDGDRVWTRYLNASGSAVGTSLSLLPDGDLVLVGSFGEDLDLHGFSLRTNGHHSGFVTRLSGDGRPIWGHAITGTSDVVARDVAVADTGNLSVLVDPLDIGRLDGPTAPPEDVELAVARLDLAGKRLQTIPLRFDSDIRTDGCGCMLSGLKIQTRSDATALVTGYYAESGVLHPHTEFAQEGFVQRVTEDGSASVVARWDGSARGLAVAPDGSFVVSGDFFGATSIGGFDFDAIAFTDVLVARFSPTAEVLWAHSFGTYAIDSATSIALGGDGAMYLAGAVGDHHAPPLEVDFGSGDQPTVDHTDAFLAKFAWPRR
jgi:hypothetical protein